MVLEQILNLVISVLVLSKHLYHITIEIMLDNFNLYFHINTIN